MKMLCLLLFLSIVGFYSCDDNNQDINDPSKRNEEWVWWVDNSNDKGEWIKVGDFTTVKNGVCTTFYLNGNICEVKRLKNGKSTDTTYRYSLHGNMEAYILMSSIPPEFYFVNNGPIKGYHRNGNVQMEGIVENHKMGRKWLAKSESGKTLFVWDFENENGHCLEYHDNGNRSVVAKGRFVYEEAPDKKPLIFHSNYVLDSGVISYYHETGELKDSVAAANGRPHGIRLSFYRNGNVHKKFNYSNGLPEGAQCSYYENGQLRDSLTCTNGHINGLVYKWQENGRLMAKSTTQNDKLEGMTYLYDRNGKLKEVAEYKDGKRIRTIEN